MIELLVLLILEFFGFKIWLGWLRYSHKVKSENPEIRQQTKKDQAGICLFFVD